MNKETNKNSEIIYQIFSRYVDERKDNEIEDDKIFKALDLLYEQKKITANEYDAVCESMCELVDMYVKLISKCPYIQIVFSNKVA